MILPYLDGTRAVLDMTVMASLCQNQPQLKSATPLQILRETHALATEILLSDLFTTPVLDAPICDGYEHSLSASADVLNPFQADGITLNTTHLLVSATSDGNISFFVMKKSQASGLITAKQVTVEVYTCADLQISQAQSDGIVYLTKQKNQGATVLFDVT